MVMKLTHYKRFNTSKEAMNKVKRVPGGSVTNARYISGNKTGYVVYTLSKKKPLGFKSKKIEY